MSKLIDHFQQMKEKIGIEKTLKRGTAYLCSQVLNRPFGEKYIQPLELTELKLWLQKEKEGVFFE